jgi:DNA-damage-inducible protein D
MADTLFHFEVGEPSFETIGVQNGATHWDEDILRDALGYQGDDSFRRVIGKAIQACISLGIEQAENFIHHDGKYFLTRFACYLVAMNGDPKKREVAEAQIYFAQLAETFQSHLEHVGNLDRVKIRDELSEGQKSLARTAKAHGVQSFGLFMDAGYRGMYNMSLSRLKEFKGLGAKEQLYDRIGKNELAANLFRVTQTDAKIKNEDIQGQPACDNAALQVGRKVRATMRELSGTSPEHLPLAEPIQQVKKRLKDTRKALDKIDKE